MCERLYSGPETCKIIEAMERKRPTELLPAGGEKIAIAPHRAPVDRGAMAIFSRCYKLRNLALLPSKSQEERSFHCGSQLMCWQRGPSIQKMSSLKEQVTTLLADDIETSVQSCKIVRHQQQGMWQTSKEDRTPPSFWYGL